MKLLLLTDGIYPHTMGGMQKHSYYLGKFLAQLGVSVDIVIPTRENKSVQKTENYLTDYELSHIEFQEVDFPRVKYFPGHYVYDSYQYSQNIYQHIKDQVVNYDYIYAQGYTAWELLKNKQNAFPPIGVNFHGVEMYQPSDSLRSHLEKLLLRSPAKFCLKKADAVYSLGGKLTALLKKLIPENHIVETSIGIEKKWLENPEFSVSKPRRFVFIGRYEKRKGIELLNKILESNGAENFIFEFIGPIPKKKQISNPSVIYHGPVYEETKIIKILDRCDVLFCPSYSEGMPTVILEAMARGLAIVATDVGAVSCLVSDQTGWLIEASNLEQLDHVFREAVNIESDVLIQKKKRAYQLIQDQYTWDKVAEINLNVIREIVS